jgi:hypothetical protein
LAARQLLHRGQYDQDAQAFEGFDFRASADVLFKRVTLDTCYERGTLPGIGG